MKEVSIENVDAWNALKAENQKLRAALELIVVDGNRYFEDVDQGWYAVEIAEQALEQTESEGD